MKGFLLSVCGVLCVVTSAVNADVVVKTPLGTVTGVLDTSVDVPVEAFRGIPFAKPPIKERRFALPEAFGPFGNLDATRYQPACVQSVKPTTYSSSEDCLHLNIFRRKGLTDAGQVPVIVMIHGGAFAFGSTQEFMYNGVPLAAYGNAIVVTIQYRLGIFGFGMTELIPANIGLYDQKLAIEWVHEHIKHFGGDNKQVTLMGVSAGSMSVSAHIISPETRAKNLFQSVIMDAGVIYRITASPKENIARMKTVAVKLGCVTSGVEMLKCLRKVKAKELVNASFDPEGYSPIYTFTPALDGKYLPKYMKQVSEDNTFPKVRMLVGTAHDEGSLFVNYNFTNPVSPKLKSDEEFVAWCAKLSFAYKYGLDFSNRAFVESLKETYLSQYKNRLLAASRFVGDGSFYCPVNAFIRDYVKCHPDNIYVYQFNRRLSKAYLSFDPAKLGVFHCSSHVHFMGSILALGPFAAPEDRNFALDSIATISKFANGESPVFRGVAWPDFASTNKIMIFDDQTETSVGLRHQEECRSIFVHYEGKAKIVSFKSEL